MNQIVCQDATDHIDTWSLKKVSLRWFHSVVTLQKKKKEKEKQFPAGDKGSREDHKERAGDQERFLDFT